MERGSDIRLTVDMYKRVTDVNVYGMVRVTKAFRPMIMEAKGIPLGYPFEIQGRRVRGGEGSGGD